MSDGYVVGIAPAFTDVVFEKPVKSAEKEPIKKTESKPSAQKKPAKKG